MNLSTKLLSTGNELRYIDIGSPPNLSDLPQSILSIICSLGNIS